MPARAPFTRLCQLAARPRLAGRADLHTHTTHSDGRHTPAEVADLARRAGLAAVAVTDHDTLAGVGPARAAAGSTLEVIAGAEVTSEFRGRELHLLALFVRPDDPPLTAALGGLRRRRLEWLCEVVRRLRGLGLSVDEEALRREVGDATPGRPHLARLLVRTGQVGSVREAFARYLGGADRYAGPRPRLPVGEAIALARAAGGVASWAHPPEDADAGRLAELKGLGLDAVEAEFACRRRSRTAALRALAAEAGLLVSGGSDCHGPGRREVGASTVSDAELAALRTLAVSRE
jgi:predicted metal-dependent phosphoesterase TrpH